MTDLIAQWKERHAKLSVTGMAGTVTGMTMPLTGMAMPVTGTSMPVTSICGNPCRAMGC